jgi:hypothetical protein
MDKKALIMEMVHLHVFMLLLLSSSCQSDDQLTQAKPLSPGDILQLQLFFHGKLLLLTADQLHNPSNWQLAMRVLLS